MAIVSEADYFGQHGAISDRGFAPAAGQEVLAGGMDYVEPEEPRDTRLCAAIRKDGERCQAYAGTNGYCVGHNR